MDNDAYGHVNNVVYYSHFDTAVNRSLAFLDTVEVGVRVAHLGTSSVRYELAVFRQSDGSASA